MAEFVNYEILDMVKIEFTLRNIKNVPTDDTLKYLIKQVVQKILNYCNRKNLPEELKGVAARMVAELYLEMQDTTILDSEDQRVASYSEDGRTVTYNTKSKLYDVAALTEEKIKRTTELSRFKYAYKVD